MSPNSKHIAAAKPVSLKVVAEQVGLSSAAVSRVLNGAPAAKSIPKATQERIFSAARQLNYRPNLLARSLRRGTSHTIGILVPEVSEGYATLVLAGLEQGLLQAGYFYYLISHHHRSEVIQHSQAMLAERAVDGIKICQEILSQPAFRPFVKRLHLPDGNIRTQEEYRQFARQYGRSAYHPVGTCRMGGGEDAVVDPDLKVRGIDRLRVCDSSVMPRLISSNTNAATVMIAEKAADILKGVLQRQPQHDYA